MTELGDSPYAVLEVARSADAAAVEAAYRRLDGLLAEGSLASYGMLDGADVGRLRHQLELAYAILSDPARRADFDRTGNTRPAGAPQPARSAAPGHAAARYRGVATAAAAVPALAPASRRAEAEAPGQALAAAPAAAGPSGPAVGATSVQASGAPTAPVHRAKVPGRPVLQVPLLAELPEAVRFDGPQLRALRESARVSIEELSEWTKIGRRYLIALENDDYGLLPAKVYVRGFVGEVARILGIDAGRVARSYLENYDAWSAQN